MSKASEFVIYVEEPSEYMVRGGIVHITDQSGNLVFKRVMPVSAFMRSLQTALNIMQEWRVDQSGKIERIEDWRDHAARS